MTQLANCDWIHKHHHLLIIGPTGMGKTTLACAITQEAINQQIPVLFYRLANLLLELLAATHEKRLNFFFENSFEPHCSSLMTGAMHLWALKSDICFLN